MRLIHIVLLLSICSEASTKSFGVTGEVFQVAEKSFLELTEERLRVLEASGKLKALNQDFLNRAALHANRPGALNLGRTIKTSCHYYVPEITLSQDLRGAQGNIIYAAGTHVNALEQLPTYKLCWLFFDADDEAQVQWAAKQHCPNHKLILTGGAVSVAEKRLQDVIYFDQAGRITSKLHIQHVPTIVTRKANQLLVCEQAIKENGDVA